MAEIIQALLALTVSALVLYLITTNYKKGDATRWSAMTLAMGWAIIGITFVFALLTLL